MYETKMFIWIDRLRKKRVFWNARLVLNQQILLLHCTLNFAISIFLHCYLIIITWYLYFHSAKQSLIIRKSQFWIFWLIQKFDHQNELFLIQNFGWPFQNFLLSEEKGVGKYNQKSRPNSRPLLIGLSQSSIVKMEFDNSPSTHMLLIGWIL